MGTFGIMKMTAKYHAEKYNGNFIISVNDFYSGICKVVISESGKNLVDNIFDNLEEIKTEYNFSVKSSELDNGEHHYIIEDYG